MQPNNEQSRPNNLNRFDEPKTVQPDQPITLTSVEHSDSQRPVAAFQPLEPMQPSGDTMVTPPTSYSPSFSPVNDEPLASTSTAAVLQWHTYALWGWTVLIAGSLASAVISSFHGSANGYLSVNYLIAAVLVLLPLAFFADKFYSRVEETDKKDSSAIIMAGHSVLFSLFAVGSLIGAIVAVIGIMSGNNDDKTDFTGLLSSLVFLALYLTTLLRILNPPFIRSFKRVYPWIMLAAIGLLVILGFIGPVAQARTAKKDSIIVNNISDLGYSINEYDRENNRLPGSLNDLTLKGDTQKLVDEKLVEYKPNSKPADSGIFSNSNYYDEESSFKGATRYYQLCVKYAGIDKSSSFGSLYNDVPSDKYSSNINPYGHGKGNTCYNVSTDGY